MKFWVIETAAGETIGCELTKKAAIAHAEAIGYARDEIELTWEDVTVSAETIRRLLGRLGGYANDSGE